MPKLPNAASADVVIFEPTLSFRATGTTSTDIPARVPPDLDGLHRVLELLAEIALEATTPQKGAVDAAAA